LRVGGAASARVTLTSTAFADCTLGPAQSNDFPAGANLAASAGGGVVTIMFNQFTVLANQKFTASWQLQGCRNQPPVRSLAVHCSVKGLGVVHAMETAVRQPLLALLTRKPSAPKAFECPCAHVGLCLPPALCWLCLFVCSPRRRHRRHHLRHHHHL
jgi:hypothetical protein